MSNQRESQLIAESGPFELTGGPITVQLHTVQQEDAVDDLTSSDILVDGLDDGDDYEDDDELEYFDDDTCLGCDEYVEDCVCDEDDDF